MKSLIKYFAIIFVVFICLWIFSYPNILPFLDVKRLQVFARNYNPELPRTEENVDCKNGRDIKIDFPTRFALAFRTMDMEYKRAVMLIILKTYRCQVEEGVNLGWPIFDEPFEHFNPLYRAFLKVAEDVPQNEYKSASMALHWLEFLKSKELGELEPEARRICKYLLPWGKAYRYPACVMHFPDLYSKEK